MSIEFNLFNTFFALAFFSILVTSIWAFIYWWKKSNYTRERFAFLGAVSLFGLLSLFLAQLTTGYSLIYFASYAIKILLGYLNLNELLNTSQNPPEPTALTPFNTVIYMMVIMGYGYWFFKVFNNWEGKKSVSQYEQERNSEKPNPLVDIALILSRNPDKRALLKQYISKEDDNLKPLITEINEQKAWNIRAKSMWSIHSRNHIFEDSFDAERKCWWGEDKNTGAIVALVCIHETPNEELLKGIIFYARQISIARNGENFQLVVAVKNLHIEREKENIDGTQVTFTSEKELLSKIVDFTDYFEDISYRVNRLKLPESDLTINDIYTPSYFDLDSNNISTLNEINRVSADEFIDEWLAENSRRHIALLGEYGQGKSTVSLMTTYNLIRKFEDGKNGRIPILIELRGKSPRSLTMEELLASWGYIYNINVSAIIQLLHAGKLLLIFEGFDEMDLTGDTDARLSHFRTLWKFAYPETKILITGRPNFFLDDSERKRALGIHQGNQQTPFCQAVYLSPFGKDQIKSSLRYVDNQTAKEIINLSINDRKFNEIVSRPSLLFIVAMLWKKEKLSEKIDSINSALIIDLFIKHSYRRQGAKQSERNFMALNTAERAFFMRGIAVYMAQNNLQNQISLSDLNSVIENLIEIVPDELSKSVGTENNEEYLPIKSHMRFDWEHKKSEILEHIKTDVRACGILVSDLSKSGTFKFAHKSFMEFLQAEHLNALTEKEGLSLICSKAIKSKMHFSLLKQSTETMMFLSELISNKPPYNSSQKLLMDMIFDAIIIGDINQGKIKRLINRSYISISLEAIKILSHIKSPQIFMLLSRLLYPSLSTLILFIVTVTTLAMLTITIEANKKDINAFYLPFIFMLGVVSTQILGLSKSSGDLTHIKHRVENFRSICNKCKIPMDSVDKYLRGIN